jgi:hypothetical protein
MDDIQWIAKYINNTSTSPHCKCDHDEYIKEHANYGGEDYDAVCTPYDKSAPTWAANLYVFSV